METQNLEAHKPFFPPSSPIKDNALPINSPNISQVFYFVLSEEENEFWFKLNLEKGHSLVLDLGTPKFDIYKNIYPDLTLYYENEEMNLDKLVHYNIENKWGLSEFHEPFTNTYSWIYVKDRYSVSRAGNYYVRIKSDYKMDYRLWFATGIIEDFGITDLAKFAGNRSTIRDFHTNNYESESESESESDSLTNLESDQTNFDNRSEISVDKSGSNTYVIYVLILSVFIILLFLYINRRRNKT
ncbi:MAG: hypothetical protein ACJ0DE_05760 [Dehalococcoidia bacterium]